MYRRGKLKVEREAPDSAVSSLASIDASQVRRASTLSLVLDSSRETMDRCTASNGTCKFVTGILRRELRQQNIDVGSLGKTGPLAFESIRTVRHRSQRVRYEATCLDVRSDTGNRSAAVPQPTAGVQLRGNQCRRIALRARAAIDSGRCGLEVYVVDKRSCPPWKPGPSRHDWIVP